MIKKNNLVAILLLISQHIVSQNLIPDPGFEITDPELCDDSNNIMPLVHWHSANETTPDLWCMEGECGTLFTSELQDITGMLPPPEGQCFAGLICCMDTLSALQTREYLYTQLIEPLEPGEHYVISCAIHRRIGYELAIDRIGFYFSNDPLNESGYEIIDVEPQAETAGTILNDPDWTTIQLSFFAQGGEQYMCMGNFRSPEEMLILDTNIGGKTINGYYQFDNVVLQKTSTNSVNSHLSAITLWTSEYDLHVENKYPGQAPYSILDITGRPIQEGTIGEGLNIIRILSNSPGIFLVNLHYGDFSGNYKILVK